MSSIEIKVPDIGDFDAVEIIEVLVATGDEVAEEETLITLESDKATMDVPSTQAGKITSLNVSVGDKVAEGDVIAVLETAEADEEQAESSQSASEKIKKAQEAEKPTDETQTSADDNQAASSASQSSAPVTDNDDYDTQVVVIGAGPGGYTAAFRAADLGLSVTLIEKHASLGGVCLNVGCIPSKALLHSAHVMDEAAAMAAHGINFGEPEIDLDKLRGFKQSVVEKLTGGLKGLAKQRKVSVLQGKATFVDEHQLSIENDAGETQTLSFAHAIIAAGSRIVELPDFPNDDARLIDSTGALELTDIPNEMLVIGGGIIGLEMANVYTALGATVDVVELTDGLLPGCDADLVKPLQKRFKQRCREIWVSTKVTGIEAKDDGLHVSFDGKTNDTKCYDKVLVAVGRRPNGDRLNAENAGITVDERGLIAVDLQRRTNVPHIFAIGDLTGQPMLAHKAVHEGKVAAEVIAGHKAAFEPRCIPSVVYTNPEAGWVGLTEAEAKAQNIDYEKGQFPWAANGRSLGMGNSDGFTKVLFDKKTERCIGAAAVGPNAGELIAELGLAIEMGADMHDIGLTIHAHPTLSESVGMAAEAAAGTLTDLYMPKK